MREDREFHERIGRIEALLEILERASDPALQAAARELVQALLDLHGAGLAAILEELTALGAPGEELLERLAKQSLIGSLLALHGLHPVAPALRVEQALSVLQPVLKMHGASVKFIELSGAVVRLRLDHSEELRTAPAENLKAMLEAALFESVPEVTSVELEIGAGGNGKIALPLVHK
jgi:hypothetical protein